MEPFVLAPIIIFAVLAIWTAISFYIPTHTMRALLKGIEDVKKGNVHRFDHDDFLKECRAESRWRKKHPVRAKLLSCWYSLRSFWYSIPDLPRDFYYDVKCVYQRFTRGWSNRDAWSVGSHISRLAYQMLKHHKKVAHGYHEIIPMPKGMKMGETSARAKKYDKEAQKAWNAALDKMIYAFKLNVQIADGDRESYIEPRILKKLSLSLRRECKHLNKEEEQARQEGMALFCKYLHYIWD